MLQGRLTYAYTAGQEIFCYYIIADSTLFSTDILAILQSFFGAVPSLIDILGDLLIDTLEGVAEGLFNNPSIDEILQYLPEEIDAGTPILRRDYLHGGTEQWFTHPVKLILAGATGAAFSDLFVLPEMLSLDIIGVEGLLVRYKEELGEDDYILPESGQLDFPVKDGKYRVILPDRTSIENGRFWDVPVVARWKHTINPGFEDYTSSCLARVLGVLVPSGEVPEGHYFHPDASLTYNDGWDLESTRYDSFLSDVGYDCSVPFTLDIPTTAALDAVGLERIWQAVDVVLRQKVSAEGSPGSNWRYPGGVVITPKKEEEPPEERLESVIIPHTTALVLLLWVMIGRKK